MVAPRSCDLLESQLNIDCGKMSQIHSFSMEFNERFVGPHIESIQHTYDTPMIVIRDLIEQLDTGNCPLSAMRLFYSRIWSSACAESHVESISF